MTVHSDSEERDLIFLHIRIVLGSISAMPSITIGLILLVLLGIAEVAASEAPFSSGLADEVVEQYQLAMVGRELTEDVIADIEEKGSLELSDHIQLLGYYAFQPNNNRISRALFRQQVVMLARRYPAEPINATMFIMLSGKSDVETVGEVAETWDLHLSQENVPSAILWNAAFFYYFHNLNRAEEIIRRGIQCSDECARWQYTLFQVLRKKATQSQDAEQRRSYREEALASLACALECSPGEGDALRIKFEAMIMSIRIEKWEGAQAYAEEVLVALASAETEDMYEVGRRGAIAHYTHTALGIAYLALGQEDSAIASLEKSIEMLDTTVESSPGPSMALADRLGGAGQWEAVQRYLVDCRDFCVVAEQSKCVEDVVLWLSSLEEGNTLAFPEKWTALDSRK